VRQSTLDVYPDGRAAKANIMPVLIGNESELIRRTERSIVSVVYSPLANGLALMAG
jgi:hypothetical protein